MKKQIIQIIKLVFVMGCIASFSCTRKSDIRLPEHTPTLVLHAYMNVGDTFRVMLGKTFRADKWESIGDSFVDNGWVLLYEGDIFKDSLRYDAGLKQYLSSHVVAKSGKTYRVVAGAQNFATVEASATSPQPVSTISIHRIKNARMHASGSSLDDIKYIYNDPANEKNYYLAALYSAVPGNGFTCVYTYDPSVEKYTQSLIPFDQDGCIGNHEILFTDKSFNGKQKELTISTYTYMLEKVQDPFNGRIYKPYFKKFNIAEEHYKYFKNTNTLSLNSDV